MCFNSLVVDTDSRAERSFVVVCLMKNKLGLDRTPVSQYASSFDLISCLSCFPFDLLSSTWKLHLFMVAESGWWLLPPSMIHRCHRSREKRPFHQVACFEEFQFLKVLNVVNKNNESKIYSVVCL